jgi:hypothetical protein
MAGCSGTGPKRVGPSAGALRGAARVKMKSARWKPPRISQRALSFHSHRRLPGPLDFPPEIETVTIGWLG